MTDVIRTDDHVLVVERHDRVQQESGRDGIRKWALLNDGPDGPLWGYITCPGEAKGPEGTHGKCGYLEPCACNDEALPRDRDRLELILFTLAQHGVIPGNTDLELTPEDWIEGTYIGVDEDPEDHGLSALAVQIESSLRLTVQPHEDCPASGRLHTIWDGEIVTPTGSCSLIGHLSELGRDALYEELWTLPPGQYPVASDNEGEEWAICHAPEEASRP